MLKTSRWKFTLYAALTVFAILLLLPTLTSQLPSWYSKVIPAEKIHLGSRPPGRHASYSGGGSRESR